jgi:hypothetical protein
MTETSDEFREDDLAEVEGELLPDREAMSVVSTGLEDPLPFPIAPDVHEEPHSGSESL